MRLLELSSKFELMQLISLHLKTLNRHFRSSSPRIMQQFQIGRCQEPIIKGTWLLKLLLQTLQHYLLPELEAH